MRKIFSFLSTFLLFATIASAQNISLTGTVTDVNGVPLPGVSVTLKNGKTGANTDASGNFSISVPTVKGTIIFSSVGFGNEERVFNKSQTLNVKLAAGNNTMQDLVVVAYGTQKKVNVTGSVSTIKGSELEDKPFSSIDKSLQGAVAGLQSSSSSGAPGSSTDIRIRGIGSITAGSSPLWVIDGIIATTDNLTSNTTSSNALSSINPDDIESITVLKDAGSSAIYGSRAANGVILVTTKKGKAGKSKLGFSTEMGNSKVAFVPTNKPLTTLESQTVLREGIINAGLATDAASADAFILDPVQGFGLNPKYTGTSTDWHKEITRTGAQRQYNVNLSGGDARTQFYTSAGYFKQDGVTLATGFQRYNGSLSVAHKATEKINFNAGLSGSYSLLSQPSAGGYFSNPVLNQFFLLPWNNPRNGDGSIKYLDSAGQFSNSTLYNPLAQAALNTSTAKTINFRGYVSADAKIFDNLKLTSKYSAEYFDINENQYNNPFYGDGFSTGGSAYAYYKRVFDYTWSNYLDFRGNLNKNKDIYFDVKAGFEAQSQKNYLLNAGGTNFPKILALQYLASTAKPTNAYSLPSEQGTNSIFSVGDFNYKDRYVLSGSFRRDGSSVFGVNRRWGNFYSVGATWNINEERFLSDSKVISLLKLRSSYGENGNSNAFGLYSALPTFGSGYNYGPNPGTALNNAGNADLTWEINKIFNVGVDFGLFKNRITGTVEYYNRETSGLIIYVPYSLTAGIAGQNTNIGAMRNKGFELSLNLKPIVSKSFNWDISANFAHNINKVEKLYLGNPIAIPYTSFQIGEGHDVQEYFTRIWAGVDPANGKPLWFKDDKKTATTSNVSEAKLSYSGKSASPKYFGSVTNTFNYKGLSIQVQFNYNFGNYVNDQWAYYIQSDGGFLGSYNQYNSQLSGWKKAGDKTNTPQIILGGNNSSNSNSTRFLYSGDYIRLRNLQFGYTLPKTVLKGTFISGANLYLRGTNLFIFKQDKNLPFDPEQGVTSSANLNVFIPKTITVGLSLTL